MSRAEDWSKINIKILFASKQNISKQLPSSSNKPR